MNNLVKSLQALGVLIRFALWYAVAEKVGNPLRLNLATASIAIALTEASRELPTMLRHDNGSPIFHLVMVVPPRCLHFTGSIVRPLVTR